MKSKLTILLVFFGLNIVYAQWVDTLDFHHPGLFSTGVDNHMAVGNDEILLTSYGSVRIDFEPVRMLSFIKYREVNQSVEHKKLKGNGVDSLNTSYDLKSLILKDRGFMTTTFHDDFPLDSSIKTRFFDINGSLLWEQDSSQFYAPVSSRIDFSGIDSSALAMADGGLIFKDLNDGETLLRLPRDTLFANIPDSLKIDSLASAYALDEQTGHYYFLYNAYQPSGWSSAWYRLEANGSFSVHMPPHEFHSYYTAEIGHYSEPYNFYVEKEEIPNWQDSTFEQHFYLTNVNDSIVDTVTYSGEMQRGRANSNFMPYTDCYWNENGILIMSQSSVWSDYLQQPVISSLVKMLDQDENPVYELQFRNTYGTNWDYLSITDISWQSNNDLYFIAKNPPIGTGVILGKIDSQGYINHPHLHRLGQDNFSELNISFYPNPTRSWLHFKGLDPRIKHQVSIHHASSGKLVTERTIQEIPKVALFSLAPGVYYVLVKNAAGLRVGRRIVVE